MESIQLRRDDDTDPGLVMLIRQCAAGVPHVECSRISELALQAVALSASFDAGLDVAIRTAATLVEKQPEYSRVAANLLLRQIQIDLSRSGVRSFADFVSLATSLDLLNVPTGRLLRNNLGRLAGLVRTESQSQWGYLGLRTLCDRYLLRHPKTGRLIESVEYFLLRAAAGLSDDVAQTAELYRLASSGAYFSSSFFQAGLRNAQLCSCFLIDSPEDSIHGIYDSIKDIALISKRSGGIGQAYHTIRSRGAIVRSTNGVTRGIVPWLKVLDSSVAAVDQGGRRHGAACVYLETWHADIEQFLSLRDNTGEIDSRTYNLQLGNWVPDLFMRRVEADESWSLFDPSDVPELRDLWGADFDTAYERAERSGKAKRTLPARTLFARMLRTLGETGNGWMTFKDACNRKCNQTARPQNVVHLSNLCTEIVEVTSPQEIAVCTLGSINLARHLGPAGVDMDSLAEATRIAVRQLDRVIDKNVYPLDRARESNLRWRPIGLGMMGLQDVLFSLRLPFTSPAAIEVSTSIAECIYFNALSTSCDLAEQAGAHPAYGETRVALEGTLQFDLWGVAPGGRFDWPGLRARIARHGLRNSLLLAIAPTATIAAIVGCCESIEPQFSNIFRRDTSSGEFVQVNRYLVEDLRQLGLWNESVREALKRDNGSVQRIPGMPKHIRELYRTVWELPQRMLIDLAAARGPFLDQSQSLNLYLESPTLEALASMYMYAWKKGLKTTYYLRSRPATNISKTFSGIPEAQVTPAYAPVPGDVCEVCQ